jgi:hypothetical protein
MTTVKWFNNKIHSGILAIVLCMNKRDGLYDDPPAIAPLKPNELPAELRELALEIVAAAARLGV